MVEFEFGAFGSDEVLGVGSEVIALMRVGGGQSLLSLPRAEVASVNQERGSRQTPTLPASCLGCPASRMGEANVCG